MGDAFADSGRLMLANAPFLPLAFPQSCRSNSQNAFAHGVVVDTSGQLTSESCLMAS